MQGAACRAQHAGRSMQGAACALRVRDPGVSVKEQKDSQDSPGAGRQGRPVTIPPSM